MYKKLFIFFAPLLALILIGGTAAAVPVMPHRAYGDVTYEGGSAASGVVVSFRNDSGDAVVFAATNSEGFYDLLIDEPADKSLNIYVGSWNSGKVLNWNSGESDRINIIGLPAPSPSVSGPGGCPSPQAPVETNLFGIEESFEISSDGEIQETIEATSEDGNLTITISEDTIALDKDGDPLSNLTSAVDVSPPAPPEDTHVIGLAYDFGPDGATFDPVITLTWSYDPDALPEGVAEENLVIAYYDESADEWRELDSEVGTENDTITASVAHFTTFAIIGTTKMAAFTLTLVDISPTEVAPGEEVNVTVSVANTGTKEGSYTVVLEINEVKESEKTVTVPAGKSELVSFTATREQPGKYNVMLGGLGGSFIVVAPSVTPEAPAVFSLSKLTVTPTEVESNEPITVTVSVANTGGNEGNYSVVLKINGVKEAEQSVTVTARKSKTVTFTVSKQVAGSYSVEINGLTGSFTVVEAAPPTTSVTPPPQEPKLPLEWPIIAGIIGGAIVVGLVIFFLVRRRAA